MPAENVASTVLLQRPDDRTPTSTGRLPVVLGAVLLAIVTGAAGFVIAHFGIDSTGAAPSIPDPETVTCGAWLNLPVRDKDQILLRLNFDNHTSETRDKIDADCSFVGAPNDPVSGYVASAGG